MYFHISGIFIHDSELVKNQKMLNKRPAISTFSFLLILFLPFLSNAQKTIENDSNFVLIYKPKIENGYDFQKYTFIGNYIIRQEEGEIIEKIFNEPIIQILDLNDNSVYEYYPQSKRIFETTPPVQLPSPSKPYTIINNKDSTINEEVYNYFSVSEESMYGPLPITSQVFF